MARKLVHAGNCEIAVRIDGTGVALQRFQIIAVAVMLAVIGAFAPIAIMLHVSWTLAVNAEHDRLATFASRAITRANRSYTETKDALYAIHLSGAELEKTTFGRRCQISANSRLSGSMAGSWSAVSQ